MKLGKAEPMHDPRTLMLADYLDGAALPTTPDSYIYAKNIGSKKWGMMENDKVGDCTCAAAGHLIMEWTDDNNSMYTPPDKDIIAAYSAINSVNNVLSAMDKVNATDKDRTEGEAKFIRGLIYFDLVRLFGRQ